jgi:hypothetical protein
MSQKLQIHKNFSILCMIFSILLSSCSPTTAPRVYPTPTTKVVSISTPISKKTSSRPNEIQNLFDQQLLSSLGGSIIWENPYLTLTETGLGVLSWQPLNVEVSNFVIYTEFTWDSDDTDETACGVSFRDNSKGDFYLSLVRKSGDGFLWLSLADQWQNSVSDSYINNVKKGNNEVNTLILIAEDEQITLIVNNSIYYQVMDSSLNSGSISFITGTAKASNTCSFRNSWIWEINKSAPVPQTSNPESTPVLQASNPESTHDIYAGFTGDSSIPVLVLHRDGEKLGISNESTSNETGVVWTSPEEESLVIYSGADGKPNKAVLGEYIVLYHQLQVKHINNLSRVDLAAERG